LLRTIVAEFIDTKLMTALPGRETYWRKLMVFWLQVELMERNFSVAERVLTAGQ
jgi:hypothetical protein